MRSAAGIERALFQRQMVRPGRIGFGRVVGEHIELRLDRPWSASTKTRNYTEHNTLASRFLCSYMDHAVGVYKTAIRGREIERSGTRYILLLHTSHAASDGIMGSYHHYA